jgi:UDP-glucuronate 4-epimerase
MGVQNDRWILVTGGAGFIGSHLTEQLLERGHGVVCLDNLNDFYHPQLKRLNLQPHLEYDRFVFYEGDIRDTDQLQTIFDRHDIGVVIHLAAMAGVRPSVRDPLHYTDVNIVGTQRLLEVMTHYPIEKFLFASSSSVYGNNEKIPFSEDDNVDYQVSPYGATKKMGEILCATYHHLYGTPTTCLRFFTVYGPRQRPEMAIHTFLRKILKGEPIPFFGDGNTARDYTYIDDIIRGVLQALEADDEFIIYNLGNSEPIKLMDLVDILSEQLGQPAHLQKMDLPKGDVVITYADITRARQRLDYNPQVRITDGIRLFAEWYEAVQATHGDLFE